MLLLSTLHQFDIDPLFFFVLLATAGLTLFFALAALAAPLLGVVTESLYVFKHQSFYDKCALQITQAAFCMGLFIFFTLGAGLIYYVYYVDYIAIPPLIKAPPLTGLLLLGVYWITWSALKQRRALHLLLGWAAALSMLGALFVFCGLLIAVDWPAFMALIYVGLLCTGLAAGAGLSQLWLIMRRFKADYGRDYYAFAMRYCARVALSFTLAAALIVCALLLLLRHAIPADLVQPLDIGVIAIAFGLPLSCCLLWFGIAKSDSPLRHKPGAFFACVFLFIALGAQLLMLLSAFPSP